MKNTQPIKLNRDFRRIYARGKSVAGGFVVVYAMPNKRSYNRAGFTVGKAFGNAVKRNRIKRLMRESYRLLSDRLLQGYDIIIVSRNRATGKSQPQIMKDIEYAMRKLGLIES